MLAVAACAGMSITSCTADKDLYSPEVAEQNVKDEYTANFMKKYGMISPDQTWDFSNGIESVLPGTRSVAKGTRAIDPTITVGDYYQVDNATLTWMRDRLEEGKDNRSLGAPFKMNMPSNSFTIVPIFVGQAGLTWDLHMVVVNQDGSTKDMKIWSKGEGMQMKSSRYEAWQTLNSGSNTLNAAAVRSLQYTIDGVPEYTPFYFYLEVTKEDATYAHKGTKQSSLDGMMLALEDCPLPSNLPPVDGEARQITLIGCEDANLSGSDHDVNDVVFLIYGNPKKPEKIEIDEKEETKATRYMVEDLGATDDFDFNDIVIDVEARRTVKYIKVNGVIDYSKTQYGDWTQTATLKHLGGTLPYNVFIGRGQLPWQVAELDVDKNETVEITGWDFVNNNITVKVQSKTNSEVFVTIPFPKAGEAPMIIATTPEQRWMGERESVPADWFYVPAE